MPQSSHDIVKAFFEAMPAGTLTTDHFTPDFAGQSITSAPHAASAETYVGGIGLLQSLFPDGLHYTIEAITAEADRAAAQVRGDGAMADGVRYANRYAFFFTIRDGRIASIFEFFDPAPVNELIMPRIAEAAAKMGLGSSGPQAVT